MAGDATMPSYIYAMEIAKRQAFVFSLKVWLTAGITTPIIDLLIEFLIIFFGYNQSYPKSMLYKEFMNQNFVGPLIGSLLIMIPMGIAIYCVLIFSSGHLSSLKRLKIYLSIIGVAFAPSVLGIIYVFQIKQYPNDNYIARYLFNGVFYSLITFVCVWFYGISTKTNRALFKDK